MIPSSKSKFQGKGQDYVDWFTLGYETKNKISLPPTMSHIRASQLQSRMKEEKSKVDTPLYKRCSQDESYSQTYIDQHIKDVCQVQSKPNERKETSISKNLELDFDEDEEEDSVDNKVQVYLHYDFHEYDPKSALLPISDLKKEILQKISAYPVVVIHGETGCGKSTQVPQFILDNAVFLHEHVNIIVTQPRKIAAISLANRVCQERGWKTGKIVGFQVGLNNTTDADTRLSYVTTEVLVQKIIRKKSLDEFTHIILDEVHERDQHTDFALLLVKKLLHTVSRKVKIILMSATIDVEKFSRYFSTPVLDQLLPAPVISVSNDPLFTVEIGYLDIWRRLAPNKMVPNYSLENPSIGTEMYQLAVNILKHLDNIEKDEHQLSKSKEVNNRGAVLVFVPGLLQIEQFIDFLKEEQNKFRWEYHPMHSSLTMDEQKNAFNNSKHGYRKIIVSTNIAESSLTVTDVKYVIDFCLTKVLQCDPDTNYTCLKMAWTSQASCIQRAGRVGRVCSGQVFRLVEKEFYKKLDSHTTPEMCRTPLFQTILKTKILEMGTPESLLALALDPPKLQDIYRSILVLKQIGALGMKVDGVISHNDGYLSPLGTIAASLPLDPHLSKLIVLGYIFGCLKETVIIAACLSLKSIHSTPFQDELNAFLSKTSWAHRSFSDCLASLHAYLVWENAKTRGRYNPPNQHKAAEWAKKTYIHLDALKEVDRLVTELNARLDILNISQGSAENPSDDQNLIIKICIAGAFFPNYFKRSVPTNYERTINRELNGKDPFSTLILSGLPNWKYNFLYDSQIKNVFSLCSQDLKIYYENTKAYMEFQTRRSQVKEKNSHFSEIPGQCPTAMHLAIKMRQIARKKIMIKLYDEEKLPSTGNGTLNSIPPRRHRLTIVNCENIHLQPPQLPEFGVASIRVIVNAVEDPNNVYVVSYDNSGYQHLMYVTNLIEYKILDGKVKPLPRDLVKAQNYCLGPYTDPHDKETKYYRCRIEQVIIQNGVTKVSLFFVDYGNSDIASIDDLKALPDGLCDIPMLAIKCSLCELEPRSKSSTECIWPSETTDYLRDRVVYQDFIASVYSIVHGVLRINLLEEETKTSINDELVRKGLAAKTEESFLSEQSHLLKERCDDEPDFVQVDTPITEKLEFKSSKILMGPHSPLEMKFIALSQAGTAKEVHVDVSSVNSTAMDLQPQSMFDRMIVSAFAVLNPSETKVILRSTTLMPNYPGFLHLCTILFSKEVELRTNKHRTAFTGALIGLGCDEAGVPVYPDDDIELAFDFNFLEKDLRGINELRYLMSSAIDTIDEGSEASRAKLQKCLRKSVTRTFTETREYREPEFFPRAYKWHQVSSEFVMKPQTNDEFDNNETIVYPLLCDIKLRSADPQEILRENVIKLKKFYSRMKEELYHDAHKIKKKCQICSVEITNFYDLRLHMTESEHLRKECQVLMRLN